MAVYSAYTDEQLLGLLRQEDRHAFNELYERHWKVVYGQAFKKLHDPELAKDITQDVFVYLWNHRLGNFIDNLPAYLFSAVRNNVFRALKNGERFVPIDTLILEARFYYPEADAVILEKEFYRSYSALVEALPPAQRNIFKLRYEEGLSTQEIAEQLKLSRGTVQNQLTRAVAMLRASLLAIAVSISQQV